MTTVINYDHEGRVFDYTSPDVCKQYTYDTRRQLSDETRSGMNGYTKQYTYDGMRRATR